MGKRSKLPLPHYTYRIRCSWQHTGYTIFVVASSEEKALGKARRAKENQGCWEMTILEVTPHV